MTLCSAVITLAVCASALARDEIPAGLHSNYRLSAPESLSLPVDGIAVAVGDVTADGLSDILVTSGYDDDPGKRYRLGVFPQLVDGSLGAMVSYPFGSEGGNGLVLADLTGDGALDVVVARFTGISVLIADGAGGFLPFTEIAGQVASNIAATDVDRDGHIDVVIRGGASGLGIYYGDGAGGFPWYLAIASPGTSSRTLEIGDLNGDGFPDLGLLRGL